MRWHILASTLITLFLATSATHAQWSFNGNKIYYTQGKVGIGTANPNSPLQIVSSIGDADRPTLLVKNINTAPEPNNAAIMGVHRSETFDGVGVWGEHDGNGWGVYGVAHGGGSGCTGVVGRAFGQGIAIRGICGPNGYAGYFGGQVYVVGNLGIGVAEPDYSLQLLIDSAAKPTSNTWTIDSDRRLKKNIKTIQGALGRLLALHGVTYQWKQPETQGNMTGTYTGMIAQEVEEVFPEWVRQREDGFKTLTVIGFEGIVVEAMRELRLEKDLEVESLRLENDELRAQNESLEERLTQLEQLVNQMAHSKEH